MIGDIEMKRNSFRIRQNYGKNSNTGHFIFNEVNIPFYQAYYVYNGRNYLIDNKYLDEITKISKSVRSLIEDIHNDNADSVYNNCFIEKVYLTTNYPDKIEVCFVINTPIDKIRDIKLNLLVSE